MEALKWFVEHLRSEGHVILHAPFSFAVSVLIAFCVSFGLVEWHYSVITDAQKATIELLHERVDRLAEELAKRSAAPPSAATASNVDQKPDLKFTVSGGGAALPSDPNWKDDYTDVVWDVRIWNTGTPTFLTDFSFVVLPRDGAPIIGLPLAIPDVLSLSGKVPSIIKGDESLLKKVENRPIGLTPMEGKVRFLVKVSQKTLLDPNTQWQFSARDSYSTPVIVQISAGSMAHN